MLAAHSGAWPERDRGSWAAGIVAVDIRVSRVSSFIRAVVLVKEMMVVMQTVVFLGVFAVDRRGGGLDMEGFDVAGDVRDAVGLCGSGEA